MIYGFTGTRKFIRNPQHLWLRNTLAGPPLPRAPIAESAKDVLHHGACVNADEESHNVAIGIGGFHVIVHPPTDQRLMMSLDNLLRVGGRNDRGLPSSVTVLPAEPYLVRNRAIVNAIRDTGVLLTLPDGPERLESGTWSTVRYAMRAGVPVYGCMPDGELFER
jgi:hypothetical protein